MIKYTLIDQNDPNFAIKNLNNQIFDKKKSFIESLSFENDKYIAHPSHCLISIEPFSLPKPSYLFCGKIKSAVANKITLSQALVLKSDNSKYIKGQSLFEVLISDEALTNALINSGGLPSPCTISSVMGKDQDYLNLEERYTSKERVLDSVDEDIKNIDNVLLELLEKIELSNKKGSFSKKTIEEIRVNLNTLVNNLPANINYAITVLESEIKKDLSSVENEMSSTINKLIALSGKKELLLENEFNTCDSDNYFQWFLDGGFSDRESSLLDGLYRSLIKDDTKESLKNQINAGLRMFNHSDNRRKKGEPSEASIEINQIYGGKKVYDQLSDAAQLLSIRFNQAKMEVNKKENCSNIKVFSQITISQDGFMELIRGSQSEKLIPCNLERIADYDISFKQVFKPKMSFLLEDNNRINKMSMKAVDKVASELFALLQPKVKKDDKILIDKKLEEFEKAFSIAKKDILSAGVKNIDDVENNFKEIFREKIDNSTKGLSNDMKLKLLNLLN